MNTVKKLLARVLGLATNEEVQAAWFAGMEAGQQREQQNVAAKLTRKQRRALKKCAAFRFA